MKPRKLQFMTRVARPGGGALLGLISIAALAPAAHAEDVEVCANRYVDVHDLRILEDALAHERKP